MHVDITSSYTILKARILNFDRISANQVNRFYIVEAPSFEKSLLFDGQFLKLKKIVGLP
jgi:hypothetical protein